MNNRQSPVEGPVGTNLPDQPLPPVLQIERVAQQAHDYVPEADTWGFFAFSDGPADAGGGTGGFLWFASHEEMLDFIQSGLPLWCPGPVHSIECAVIANLKETVASIEKDGANVSSRDRLNVALKGYAQIEWWGPFGELLAGDTAFAKEIRKWFRSNGGQNDGTGLIPGDQAHHFSESLREYGV